MNDGRISGSQNGFQFSLIPNHADLDGHDMISPVGRKKRPKVVSLATVAIPKDAH